MSWTTPGDLKEQLGKLWEKGTLPEALLRGESLFPKKLRLKKPSSSELAERFDEVRRWIGELRRGESRGYRILWREVNHAVLGRNRLPEEIWIDEPEAALKMIGKTKEAAVLQELCRQTLIKYPELEGWLYGHPLKLLEYAGEWKHFLFALSWVRRNPRCNLYLRQVDLPGVDSKFLETHRGILGELLDQVLPPEAIRQEHRGVRGFARRYGFRDKPELVRFRILDPALALLPGEGEQDITIPSQTFGSLKLPLRRIFMTENEINFLAFPPAPGSLVLFGGGYGFEALKSAPWLRECPLFYWGDLDTHGFAILDQLRGIFPQVESFLMDEETLLEHREFWGEEPQPEIRDLRNLTPAEGALYDDLRYHHHAPRLRLEQERIRFGWVQQRLEKLVL
jgi:hypothetical protein